MFRSIKSEKKKKKNNKHINKQSKNFKKKKNNDKPKNKQTENNQKTLQAEEERHNPMTSTFLFQNQNNVNHFEHFQCYWTSHWENLCTKKK
jgi:hypothetical protein